MASILKLLVKALSLLGNVKLSVLTFFAEIILGALAMHIEYFEKVYKVFALGFFVSLETDDKIYIYKIANNVLSKLYHIENCKT